MKKGQKHAYVIFEWSLYDNIVGDSRDVLRFLKLFSRHETHKSSELVSSLQGIIRKSGVCLLQTFLNLCC